MWRVHHVVGHMSCIMHSTVSNRSSSHCRLPAAGDAPAAAAADTLSPSTAASQGRCPFVWQRRIWSYSLSSASLRPRLLPATALVCGIAAACGRPCAAKELLQDRRAEYLWGGDDLAQSGPKPRYSLVDRRRLSLPIQRCGGKSIVCTISLCLSSDISCVRNASN